MAENVTVARPYAEAAFQLAQTGNALSGWAEALARMAAVAEDPDMRACIDNPRLSSQDLARFFLGVVGEGLPVEQQNFVRVLVDNGRLGVLPEISEQFVLLKNGCEGTKEAQVTSAFPIDAAGLSKLVAELERRFQCKIQASVSIDPELIGGVRIAVGDQVIDASVRGKLAAMSAALQN
ncbi:MAG TPA: F0F1 ATP synthase subunit delta [Rhodocyclaceae bacterium]|nr:F0F1 ATP synthase subunit delta [Rhodocyclaceae bacterium]